MAISSRLKNELELLSQCSNDFSFEDIDLFSINCTKGSIAILNELLDELSDTDDDDNIFHKYSTQIANILRARS